MKSLGSIERKNGFDYTLIHREGNLAIYEQHYTEKTKYFELFIIQVKAKQNLFGKSYPEREKFPADSDFGKTAWSFRNFDDALARFKRLVEEEKFKQVRRV